FANSIACVGPFLACIDSSFVCCDLPTGFGFSVQFNDLPVATQGQGYTDVACSSFLFVEFGPGTGCWNGAGQSISSINHFPAGQGRSGIDTRAAAEASTNCSSPSYFKYE
ncbi:hypothetical protein BDZ97DRAFT_1631870, partial [Flammula alnicola]